MALLGFLKKAGQPEKTGWVWGGVGAGLTVSALLAVAVKAIFGTGAFGNNNFLIAGWTGIFAAVMLIWVSYWLHSKSSVQGWNSYIKEQPSIDLLALYPTWQSALPQVLLLLGAVATVIAARRPKSA